MSKVLLTGASGFLGRHIYEYLKPNVSEIISVGRIDTNSVVSDLSLDVPLLTFCNVDLVIHAAGKAHSIPKTEIEKKQFYDVNVKGTKNLLIGLEGKSLPKQFVFISSVSVYGQNFGSKINEDSVLNAKDPYGLSKIKAELLVQEWCKKYNVVCTILRLPLLVGKNPPGNLGAMIKAINKGYYFNVGGGKAKKSMVLVDDVAAFIPKVAAIGGVYNLTDGVHPDFISLSSAISKQNNKKTPLNMPILVAKMLGNLGDFVGKKAPINSIKLKKITSDLTFDDAKAREIGWKPRGVLEYLKENVIY